MSQDADVIIVGAGPAGATTAAYAARSGLKVLLLEKTAFPREKVCGDGRTPRAVKDLVDLGIDISEEAGWRRNHGLRLRGGKADGTGISIEVPWPEVTGMPTFGLVRTRQDFDETLAREAQRSGAELIENCSVVGPVLDDSGRIQGVKFRRADRSTGTYRAPVVVAADGNSARLPLAMGIHRNTQRPMGVAVRAYFTSIRHDDDWMESWVELWEGEPGASPLLPGYGWIFGVGDGTSNVGLGILNSSGAFQNTDYRDLLMRWVSTLPEEWGYRPENMVGKIGGAALPMGFNRTPHYGRGLLLVGDSGGMVNPFNGEGIAYAMESGRLAAEALARSAQARTPDQREAALARYPKDIQDAWGGYFRMGETFVWLIGHPQVMRIATKYGLPRRWVMTIAVKVLANLVEPRSTLVDRMVAAMMRTVPSR